MCIKHVTPKVFQEQIESGFLGKDKLVGAGEGANTTMWLAMRRPVPKEKATLGLFWYKRAMLSFYSWDQSND